MPSREVINSLMPDGDFWNPTLLDDYDLLLDGIADNSDEIKNDLDELRNLRDPMKTILLPDLEKEIAIIPSAIATEIERRERLSNKMFNRGSLPTYTFLEERLQNAGFDVQVHANSPAVDPATFLDEAFQMTAGDLLPGGNDAQAGEPEAYAGRIGGELLVNGEFYEQEKNLIVLAGETLAQADEPTALAGNYDSINLLLIEYEIPTDSGYWPLMFFVGGDSTRNASGELTEIEIAQIPIERRLEFRRIILRYKPMCSWGGLIVVYV